MEHKGFPENKISLYNFSPRGGAGYSLTDMVKNRMPRRGHESVSLCTHTFELPKVVAAKVYKTQWFHKSGFPEIGGAELSPT